MVFTRSGIGWACGFGLAAGALAALREASLWTALACGAVTAVVVLLTRYTAVRLANRPPSLKLPRRAKKAAKRIRKHVAKATSTESGNKVIELTYEIEFAIKRRANSADTGLLARTAICVDRLEDLSAPGKLPDREIAGLDNDLGTIKADLENIKKQDQRKS